MILTMYLKMKKTISFILAAMAAMNSFAVPLADTDRQHLISLQRNALTSYMSTEARQSIQGDPLAAALSWSKGISAPDFSYCTRLRGHATVIVAHADDDFHFINPDIQKAIDAGYCVTVVYLTGGESQSDPAYDVTRFHERIGGVLAAYKYMVSKQLTPTGQVDSTLWKTSWRVVDQGKFAVDSLLRAGFVHTAYMAFQPKYAIASQPNAKQVVEVITLGLPNNRSTDDVNMGAVLPWNAALLNTPLFEIFANPSRFSVTVGNYKAAWSKQTVLAYLDQLMLSRNTGVVMTTDPHAKIGGNEGLGDHPDHIATGKLVAQVPFVMARPALFRPYKGYSVDSMPVNMAGQDSIEKIGALWSYYNQQLYGQKTKQDSNLMGDQSGWAGQCANYIGGSGAYDINWVCKHFHATPASKMVEAHGQKIQIEGTGKCLTVNNDQISQQECGDWNNQNQSFVLNGSGHLIVGASNYLDAGMTSGQLSHVIYDNVGKKLRVVRTENSANLRADYPKVQAFIDPATKQLKFIAKHQAKNYNDFVCLAFNASGVAVEQSCNNSIYTKFNVLQAPDHVLDKAVGVSFKNVGSTTANPAVEAACLYGYSRADAAGVDATRCSVLNNEATAASRFTFDSRNGLIKVADANFANDRQWANGACLEMKAVGVGGGLQPQACDVNAPNQQFTIRKMVSASSTPEYSITSQVNGLCVTSNGSMVVMKDCVGANRQRWSVAVR